MSLLLFVVLIGREVVIADQPRVRPPHCLWQRRGYGAIEIDKKKMM